MLTYLPFEPGHESQRLQLRHPPHHARKHLVQRNRRREAEAEPETDDRSRAASEIVDGSAQARDGLRVCCSSLRVRCAPVASGCQRTDHPRIPPPPPPPPPLRRPFRHPTTRRDSPLADADMPIHKRNLHPRPLGARIVRPGDPQVPHRPTGHECTGKRGRLGLECPEEREGSSREVREEERRRCAGMGGRERGRIPVVCLLLADIMRVPRPRKLFKPRLRSEEPHELAFERKPRTSIVSDANLIRVQLLAEPIQASRDCYSTSPFTPSTSKVSFCTICNSAYNGYRCDDYDEAFKILVREES